MGGLPRPDQESGRGTMDVTGVAWRTSSYSGSNGGTCVEVGTSRPSRSGPRQQAPKRPPASLRPRHLAGLHRPAEGDRLTRDELLARLAGLRQAPIDQKRAPHKPLLLLWLFGQFAAHRQQRGQLPAGRRACQPADQRFRPARGQSRRRPPAGRHALRPPGTRPVGPARRRSARRSARTHPSAAPGYWTAEP